MIESIKLTEHSRNFVKKITPFGYYRICLTSKYADRHGRASRKEFWSFVVFQVIIGALLYLISVLVDPFLRGLWLFTDELPIPVLWLFLGTLFSVGTTYPLVSVAIRRMHDWNQSGKLLLVSLLPYLIFIIGIFFLEKSYMVMITLVFLPPAAMIAICVALLSVRASPGSNKYGELVQDY